VSRGRSGEAVETPFRQRTRGVEQAYPSAAREGAAHADACRKPSAVSVPSYRRAAPLQPPLDAEGMDATRRRA